MNIPLTILLPAHNEGQRLSATVRRIRQHALFHNLTSILIIENGSSDDTRKRADRLAKKFFNVRVIRLPKANYGEALKKGIMAAQTNIIVIFNVDYIDFRFVREGLRLLSSADIIAGSKLHPLSSDKRPWLRRYITRILHLLLRIGFGYQGPDTHGLKIIRRSAIRTILRECHEFRELFDTELMLRAYRQRISIAETPVRLQERRSTVSKLWIRVPRALFELLILWIFIHGKR